MDKAYAIISIMDSELIAKIRQNAKPMVVCQNSMWVKCGKCGWEGYDWQMVKGYVPLPPDDVAPMMKCPVCGLQEDMCEMHELGKDCPKCGMRLEHFSGLEKCPEFLYCPVCNDRAYDYDGKELFRLV